MFIAQIYKFTVGAIINRPKKVCAIYAGEQCSPLQEKPLIERFLWPSPDGEGGPPNGGGRGEILINFKYHLFVKPQFIGMF